MRLMRDPIIMWLYLLFLGLFILFLPYTPKSIEALAELAAANNLVQFSRADINTLIWSEHTSNPPGTWGDDGNLYLRSDLRPTLIGIPLLWLGHTIPGLNAIQMGQLTFVLLFALGVALIIWLIIRWHKGPARWKFVVIGLAAAVIVAVGLLTSEETEIWRISSKQIAWHILMPPFIIIFMAVINLTTLLQGGQSAMPFWRAAGVAIFLLGLTMVGAAHLAAKPSETLFADMLTTITAHAQPNDALIITDSVGNIQATTSYLLGYHNSDLPTHLWVDAIEPIDMPPHARIWPKIQTQRIWLMETNLQKNDPLRDTAAFLNQTAFPQSQVQFDDGQVTQYAVATEPITPITINVPFELGLTLVDFGVAARPETSDGLLLVRLTWMMAETPIDVTQPPIVAFVHLLSDAQNGKTVAQVDRILVDFANHHQSSLLPGQTVSQGYALLLPENLDQNNYSIIVGLYDASTVQRLVRADDSPDDFLYLTTVELP